MEVITFESETYKSIAQMFAESQEIIKAQADELFTSKYGWLDPQQVADLTKYDEKTIRLKKTEIGYSTKGKNIKFRIEDVNAWMLKTYRGPKAIK